MSFKELLKFLSVLQKNNTKEWMDAHRKEYIQVRDFYIQWLDSMNNNLLKIDPDYFNTPGKKAINRINNNLMFHPNRPVYKDHFGAGLDQRSKQGDFYIEMGVTEIFIGGGYWHPSAKALKSIRDAIDYNGDALIAILSKPSFKNVFGQMIEGDKLKTAPKGFSSEHKYIELLRRKLFAVGCTFSQQAALKSDFENKVVEIYKEMLPFRRYLNKAVTV
jgi:uncharacterized protein (TIGR02453 family)